MFMPSISTEMANKISYNGIIKDDRINAEKV